MSDPKDIFGERTKGKLPTNNKPSARLSGRQSRTEGLIEQATLKVTAEKMLRDGQREAKSLAGLKTDGLVHNYPLGMAEGGNGLWLFNLYGNTGVGED